MGLDVSLARFLEDAVTAQRANGESRDMDMTVQSCGSSEQLKARKTMSAGRPIEHPYLLWESRGPAVLAGPHKRDSSAAEGYASSKPSSDDRLSGIRKLDTTDPTVPRGASILLAPASSILLAEGGQRPKRLSIIALRDPLVLDKRPADHTTALLAGEPGEHRSRSLCAWV